MRGRRNGRLGSGGHDAGWPQQLAVNGMGGKDKRKNGVSPHLGVCFSQKDEVFFDKFIYVGATPNPYHKATALVLHRVPPTRKLNFEFSNNDRCARNNAWLTIEKILQEVGRRTAGDRPRDKSSTAMTAEDAQITCSFITKLPPDLRIPETPLAVPANVTRLGLSTVINHLLGFGANVDTLNASRAVYCVAVGPDRPGLVAFGGADPAVRLWDSRAKADPSGGVKAFSSHKGWVVGVAWRPGNSQQFGSASHDGTIKLWDIRSGVPLHTLSDHKDKVIWHTPLLVGTS
eukprot:jgi/Botrbrau1/22702/Bobra.0132s0041.1